MLCLCFKCVINVFDSAGLNWKEDAETFEASFYKRSVENDLYIFTPTPYLDRDNCKSYVNVPPSTVE